MKSALVPRARLLGVAVSVVLVACSSDPAVDAGATDASLDVPTDVSATDLGADVPATDVPAADVPAADVPATDVPTTDVPATDVPTTDVPVASGVVEVAMNRGFSCARLGDGTVRCAGANAAGQLGRMGSFITPAPAVPGINSAISVAVGGNFACAVLADHSVRCWGGNANGQLGNGTTTSSATPVTAAVTGAVQVVAGDAHACARRMDGSVVCWGSNDTRQLGAATPTSQSLVPVTVTGAAGATRIAARQNSACAIVAGGGLWCWGALSAVSAGAAVAGVSNVVSVALGGSYACAAQADGVVKCWGANASGEQGRMGAGSDTPMVLPGVAAAEVAVSNANSGQTTCVRLTGGTVQCVGSGQRGGLGDGRPTSSADPQYTPVTASGLADVVQLAVGANGACAVKRDGTLWCWGDNATFQLFTDSLVPLAAPTRTAL